MKWGVQPHPRQGGVQRQPPPTDNSYPGRNLLYRILVTGGLLVDDIPLSVCLSVTNIDALHSAEGAAVSNDVTSSW